MYYSVVSILGAIAAISSTVEASYPQVYHDQNVTSEINGIKILKGTRGSGKSLIPFSKAFSQVSVLRDDSLEPKLKSGEISEVTFTQDDVDALAQSIPNGVYHYYSKYPISGSSEQKVPLLYPDLNQTKVTCCKAPETKSAIDTKQTKIKTNASRRATPSRLMQKRQSFVANLPIVGLPLLPSIDYFYHQEVIWTALHAPGAPVAYRTVGLDTSFFGTYTRGFHVAFRSESTAGLPTLDTASVVIPEGNDNKHVGLYQNHEDGRSIDCHQSFMLAIGSTDSDMLLFTQHLNWTVIVPDYEGALALFGANQRSAKSVLNAGRAFVGTRDIFGVKNSEFFLFGYSSGALVSAMAAEMHHSYAPDLDVRAIAIGGFVAKMSAAVNSVNKGRYAGFIPMQLGALSLEHPDFAAVLATHINLAQAWKFVVTLTCSFILLLFIGDDMFDLTTLGEQFTYESTVYKILQEESAGKNAFDFPLYVFQSTDDQSANVTVVDEMVDIYCKGGTRVSYLRDNNGNGHLDEEGERSGTIINYFTAIVEGRPPHTCTDWQSAQIPVGTY